MFNIETYLDIYIYIHMNYSHSVIDIRNPCFPAVQQQKLSVLSLFFQNEAVCSPHI